MFKTNVWYKCNNVKRNFWADWMLAKTKTDAYSLIWNVRQRKITDFNFDNILDFSGKDWGRGSIQRGGKYVLMMFSPACRILLGSLWPAQGERHCQGRGWPLDGHAFSGENSECHAQTSRKIISRCPTPSKVLMARSAWRKKSEKLLIQYVNLIFSALVLLIPKL